MVCSFRAAGLTMDLWSVLWASGVVGLLGVRGYGLGVMELRGSWGGVAQLRGVRLNLAKSGRLIKILHVSTKQERIRDWTGF